MLWQNELIPEALLSAHGVDGRLAFALAVFRLEAAVHYASTDGRSMPPRRCTVSCGACSPQRRDGSGAAPSYNCRGYRRSRINEACTGYPVSPKWPRAGVTSARVRRIYAEAFAKNPQLYKFRRTLQAYEKILGGNTTIFLPADSEVFRLLGDEGKSKTGSSP